MKHCIEINIKIIGWRWNYITYILSFLVVFINYEYLLGERYFEKISKLTTYLQALINKNFHQTEIIYSNKNNWNLFSKSKIAALSY